MDPQQQPQPPLTVMPDQSAATPPPSIPSAQPEPSPLAINSPAYTPPKRKNKLLLIVAGSCGVLILLLVISGIVALTQNSKPKNSTTKKSTTSTSANVAQPATALDVEQTNNAIDQGLSSLSDTRDFKSESLEDASLGL